MTVDLATRLPSGIYAQLMEITAKLELGEVRAAYETLNAVKWGLQDDDRYISSVPVDLCLEHQLHHSVYAYRQGMTNPDTGHLYKKVFSFTVLAADPAQVAKQGASGTSEMSMRDLIKAKRIAKMVEGNDFSAVEDRGSTRYLPYAQAILYNYFSSLITYPIYVHSEVRYQLCLSLVSSTSYSLIRTLKTLSSSCN